MVELLLANISYFALYISCLCVLSTVVTEFCKEIKGFELVPTRLFVLLLHVGFNILALFVIGEYFVVPILWYYIVGAILGSFITAKISIDGYDSVLNLWVKFRKAE